MEVARTLPDEDITGHFLRCAMGLFLESLCIISANAGFTLTYQLAGKPAPGPLLPFAELELSNGSGPSPYPNDLFSMRSTSRLPSNGEAIASEATALLKRVEPSFGQAYHQLDSGTLIEEIIQENITAVFHDLNIPSYHDEIARWFRYSDEEAETKSDGLDYRCMGMPAAQLQFMKWAPQAMKWPVSRGIMRGVYRRQIGRVSHLGMITGPFFDDEASVKAGRYLMRFWLELARLKIHIHPFGNLVTNPQASTRVRQLTGLDDIWLVFRIGHTDAPPRSHRRSLGDILIHD